jgi:hypothetical protein
MCCHLLTSSISVAFVGCLYKLHMLHMVLVILIHMWKMKYRLTYAVGVVYVVFDLCTGQTTVPRLLCQLEVKHPYGRVRFDAIAVVTRHISVSIIALERSRDMPPYAILHTWVLSVYTYSPSLNKGNVSATVPVQAKYPLPLSINNPTGRRLTSITPVHQHGILVGHQGSMTFFFVDHLNGQLVKPTILAKLPGVSPNLWLLLPLPCGPAAEKKYGVVSPHKTRTNEQWQESYDALEMLVINQNPIGPDQLSRYNLVNATLVGGEAQLQYEPGHPAFITQIYLTRITHGGGGQGLDEEEMNDVVGSNDIRIALMLSWKSPLKLSETPAILVVSLPHWPLAGLFAVRLNKKYQLEDTHTGFVSSVEVNNTTLSSPSFILLSNLLIVPLLVSFHLPSNRWINHTVVIM